MKPSFHPVLIEWKRLLNPSWLLSTVQCNWQECELLLDFPSFYRLCQIASYLCYLLWVANEPNSTRITRTTQKHSTQQIFINFYRHLPKTINQPSSRYPEYEEVEIEINPGETKTSITVLKNLIVFCLRARKRGGAKAGCLAYRDPCSANPPTKTKRWPKKLHFYIWPNMLTFLCNPPTET